MGEGYGAKKAQARKAKKEGVKWCEMALDIENMIIPPKRRCHDCGKPSDDYRCPECWNKLRARTGSAKTLICGGVYVEIMNECDWIYG